ncbi:hypothetical protein [Nitrospira sp. BLG_2]|uniref:hypothetical protein n=1 Tax=Nitrospira sp. BLG_2 TaxID=3397507 RepID=UPI003B98E756
MIEETYEGESPRLKFKTKDGITVQVTNRFGQVCTDGGQYETMQWVVVQACFKSNDYLCSTMVYNCKMLADDLATKRREILTECQKEEYEKAVDKKLKYKEKDELHEFRMSHMLYEVGDDYIIKSMARSTELTIRKMLDESPLFAVFVRDFKNQ